jgi:hypothetical protein
MGGIIEGIKGMNKPVEDGLAKIYDRLVGNLFNEKKILMLTRIRASDIQFIVKMLILEKIFLRYFEKCHITYDIQKHKTPPYYKVKTIETMPLKKPRMGTIFKEFRNDFLKLMVSMEGKGRDEALKIVESARENLMQQDQMRAMGGVPPQ